MRSPIDVRSAVPAIGPTRPHTHAGRGSVQIPCEPGRSALHPRHAAFEPSAD